MEKIRAESRRLVESGEIERLPCLICGGNKDVTIHHVEPIEADGFVFLCRRCHKKAHRPVYRTVKIPVGAGQFSIRPEAAIRRREPATCG